MSKRRTHIPEELQDLFQGSERTTKARRHLEALKIDWDRVPTFVAGYLKAQFVEDVLVAMEAQNLTQTDLAVRLGESRQYVSRILKEQANFTIETMAKLACALGLNLSIRLHEPDTRVDIIKVQPRRFETPVAYAHETAAELEPPTATKRKTVVVAKPRSRKTK